MKLSTNDLTDARCKREDARDRFMQAIAKFPGIPYKIEEQNLFTGQFNTVQKMLTRTPLEWAHEVAGQRNIGEVLGTMREWIGKKKEKFRIHHLQYLNEYNDACVKVFEIEREITDRTRKGINVYDGACFQNNANRPSILDTYANLRD